jgi:hypothetical protein
VKYCRVRCTRCVWSSEMFQFRPALKVCFGGQTWYYEVLLSRKLHVTSIRFLVIWIIGLIKNLHYPLSGKIKCDMEFWLVPIADLQAWIPDNSRSKLLWKSWFIIRSRQTEKDQLNNHKSMAISWSSV